MPCCCPACSSRSPSASTSSFPASPSGWRRSSRRSRSCGCGPAASTSHLLARFWTKIFAVSFAMGVVSGIMMSYQFGTNWSRFSEVVGNVVGPLIGYEVLTAFFLEATFLGVMLFGWNRVPHWLHVTSTMLVAVGTSMSAFWILVGEQLDAHPGRPRDRRRHRLPVDWMAIIFNPSFPYRFAAHADGVLPHDLARGAGGRRALPRRRPLRRGSDRRWCGWGSAWSCCSRRCSSSSATCTASTRRSTSRRRSPRWRRTGTAAKPAPLVLFAWPDEKNERNARRDRHPQPGEPHHHPRTRRPVPRPEGLSGARSGRRWSRCSSPSGVMVGARPADDRASAPSAHGCGGGDRLFDTRWYLQLGRSLVADRASSRSSPAGS